MSTRNRAKQDDCHLGRGCATNSMNPVHSQSYSWYLYPEPEREYEFEFGQCLSAAKYIEGVNEENVIIIDGLTKKHFLAKRDYVLNRLAKIGLKVAIPPIAIFYIWLDLSLLPAPLDNGLTFFEELLKEKAIYVPGIFFDLNPARRRDLFASPCHHFVRLSFGPSFDQLEKGLDAIERVLLKGMTSFGGYSLEPAREDDDVWAEVKKVYADGEVTALHPVQKKTYVSFKYH
ncbi:hypothetical protein FRC01_008023 [Tulasnella sp. 417]|nr:hypothetical protein FRC01_008023 [Tulasnella sp. 417]